MTKKICEHSGVEIDMTTQKPPRTFWLAKPDLDFDLNWKHIHAAEFPNKGSIFNALHVIEMSAYQALEAKLEVAKEALKNIGAAVNDDRVVEFDETENEAASAWFDIATERKNIARKALAKLESGE